ncbi:MAG: type 1 glutamine amidotransferase [Phycisphaerales bacterium]
MRVHYLQHVPFEDAANIAVWAKERGHTVTATRLYEGAPFPDVAGIGLLAIMGGPMNVYQYRDYPWLAREKAFLEQALAAGVPTIGVCLGAQLVADVLGAKVVQNPQVEIGWHTVRLTREAARSRFFSSMPAQFTAFHWHGDTFETPAGATRLAASDACSNQAFEHGGHVVGLQFHLEYATGSIEAMLAQCGDELVEAPFVQDRDQIRAGYGHVPTTQRLLTPLLDTLAGNR